MRKNYNVKKENFIEFLFKRDSGTLRGCACTNSIDDVAYITLLFYIDGTHPKNHLSSIFLLQKSLPSLQTVNTRKIVPMGWKSTRNARMNSFKRWWYLNVIEQWDNLSYTTTTHPMIEFDTDHCFLNDAICAIDYHNFRLMIPVIKFLSCQRGRGYLYLLGKWYLCIFVFSL